MKRKKVLYIMHVSWHWIKQRPQYIAEELSKEYDVDVVFLRSFIKENQNTNENKISGNLIAAKRLPFQRISHLPIIKWIYKYFDRILFAASLPRKFSEYDIIWLTAPLNRFIPSNLSNVLVYDCMDDMQAMAKEGKLRNFVKYQERELYIKSDIVFCSATFLAEKLRERYGEREIVILNNAVSDKLLGNRPEKKENDKHNNFVICYIGTISSWFDFNLLKRAVIDFPDVEFEIFGPNDVDLPNIERVNFRGILPHDRIKEIMAESDALIMPFIVNDIIKSVNPVKLYEYIYSCKPILAPKYTESEYFKEFVELYSDYDEFKIKLKAIMNEEYSIDEKARIGFVANNTWANRYNLISKRLNNLHLSRCQKF